MSGATLEEVAEKAGSRVSTASGVSLKFPSIQGAGGNPEPDVIGAAYALPLNEVSAPIQGANGVWVIAPVTRNEVEASGDFASQVNSLNDRSYFRTCRRPAVLLVRSPRPFKTRPTSRTSVRAADSAFHRRTGACLAGTVNLSAPAGRRLRN